MPDRKRRSVNVELWGSHFKTWREQYKREGIVTRSGECIKLTQEKCAEIFGVSSYIIRRIENKEPNGIEYKIAEVFFVREHVKVKEKLRKDQAIVHDWLNYLEARVGSLRTFAEILNTEREPSSKCQPLINYNYLSIADPEWEGFLGGRQQALDAFERSLMLNFLFDDNRMLLLDSWFFITNAIKDHITTGRHFGLFGACLTEGIVVPAFRGKDTYSKGRTAVEAEISFREMLHIMQTEYDFAGVHEDAERIANSLDEAMNYKLIKVTGWPQHSVAQAFDELIKKYLVSSKLPHIQGDGEHQDFLDDLWKRTKKLRYECLNEARKITKDSVESDFGGLRRSDILKALSKELFGEIVRVPNIMELLHIMDSTRDATIIQKKEEVKYFWWWITHIYQWNQAREFKCNSNFPAYNHRVDNKDSLINTSLINNDDSISYIVNIPPLPVLKKLRRSTLIDFRRGMGAAYLGAVKAWRSNSTSKNADTLEHLLRSYADHISEETREERGAFHPDLLRVTLKTGLSTPEISDFNQPDTGYKLVDAGNDDSVIHHLYPTIEYHRKTLPESNISDTENTNLNTSLVFGRKIP